MEWDQPGPDACPRGVRELPAADSSGTPTGTLWRARYEPPPPSATTLLHLGHGLLGRDGSQGGGQPGLGDEWGDGQHEGHSQHEEREQMHFSMFEGFNLSDSNAFCFSFNLIKVRMTLLSFFGFIASCCKYTLGYGGLIPQGPVGSIPLH